MADWLDELDALAAQSEPTPAIAATPVATTPSAQPSWWERLTSPTSVGGISYDIGGGIARAGAGIADLVAIPIELGYRAQNKLLDALLPYNPLDPRNIFAGNAEAEKLLAEQRAKDDARSIAPFSTTTAQAIQDVADYYKIPMSAERQELISALVPTSAGGKAAMLKEAGLGLLSYGGSELGENVVGTPTAAIAGGVAPLALLGGASAASKLISKPAGVLAGSDSAMQKLVTDEIMSRMTPDDIARVKFAQEFPKTALSPTGAPMTLAEITGSPAIAQYQQSTMANTAAGRPLIDALEARREAAETGLADIGIPTQQGEFSTELQKAAAQAEKQKAAQVGSLAEGLGLTPEVKDLTRMEKGGALLASLQAKAEEAYTPVREAWSAVGKDETIDIAKQLNEVAETSAGYLDLTRKQITPLGRDLIRKANRLLEEQDGIVTVGDYQDMLGTANFILRETKQPIGDVERGLLNRLKSSLLDIEPSGINAASEAHRQAVAATREYRQTYSQGVVGSLLQERGGQLVTKASQAVKKALKNPEDAQEIVQKFGRNSTEALTIRTELMAQLDAAKSPTEFIARNKDLFNIFESDLSTIRAYAKAKETGTGLERFANVVDASIPNLIFENETVAKDFAKRFKGTPLELMGRRRFVDELKRKKGVSYVDEFNRKEKIGKQILGPDYDKVKTLLSELDQLTVPGKLESIATGKQSITFTRGTAFTRLMQDRAVLEFLSKRAAGLGYTTGATAGLATFSWLGPLAALPSIAFALVGGVSGEQVGKAAIKRLDDLTRIAADITSNPKMLELASGPGTEAATQRLANYLLELYKPAGMSAARQQTVDTATQAPTDDMSWLNDLNALADQAGASESPVNAAGLEDIQASAIPGAIINRGRTNPVTIKPPVTADDFELPTITVGKQDVSIPVGEEFADPDLIKAMIKVESGGNPNAVSPKGATGLLQLMPATAKELGVKNIRDPQENVEAGSRYTAQQIKKFGELELALAAYNWGPGNVRNAVRRIEAQGVEPTWDNIVETLRVPAETRNYVKKVMSLYA